MRCPICGSKDCCGGHVAQQVERLETGLAELIVKAQAVLDRWDSPLWKDAEPTAVVIHNLRVVVEKLIVAERLN